MASIELRQQIELIALLSRADAGWRRQIENGITVDAQLCALMSGRHEAGAPVGRPGDGAAALIEQDHERRQVLVDRAQAVTHPRTEARITLSQIARVHLQQAAAVREAVRIGAANDGEVINAAGKMWIEVGYLNAGLTVLGELA